MGAQDALPPALAKRHKVISLSEGGSLVLTRWTLAKTMMMAGWTADAMKGMALFEEGTAGKSVLDIAKVLVTSLGDKLPEFLSMSVDPVDRATVMDLPADDALEVLEAVVELNITDKFLGKVKGLLGRFKFALPAANSKST